MLDALAQDFAARQLSTAAIHHVRQAGRLLGAFLQRRRVRDLRAVTDAHVTAFARESPDKALQAAARRTRLPRSAICSPASSSSFGISKPVA